MSDVLDRIGAQLIAAESALHHATTTPASRGRWSRRRRPRSLARRHLAVVAVLVCASGSAGGLAIAGSLAGGTVTDRQYLYQRQTAVPVRVMTPDQTADLAILRRARTPADVIPSGSINSNPSTAVDVGADGANVELSRLAQVSDGIGVWVMPANDGLVCLAVGPVDPSTGATGGGPDCRPVGPSSPAARSACDGPDCNDTVPPGQTVTQGNLFADYESSRRDVNVIAGVVPDGISTVTIKLDGGGSESVPARNNVYLVALRRTGSLPVYANLGESPPPRSARETLTITFAGPHGTITAPVGPAGATYTFAKWLPEAD
jgi:hypothetical protein